MTLRGIFLWKLQQFAGRALARLLWPRPGAFAVVVDGDDLLAIDTGDYLMLPGGGLEPGESFRDAARRETSEESGQEIETGEVLVMDDAEVIFRAELREGRRPLEGSWEGEPRWIPVDEAGERSWRHDRDLEELLDRAGL